MIDKECRETVYITPLEILDPVRAYFGGQIALDPATEYNNPTGAELFYTEEDDGLRRPWYNGVFVNPPYGRVLQKWTAKIASEATRGRRIVALLPGQRFETKYWQSNILTVDLDAIVFLRSRVKFLRPDGSLATSNPYGSMLYIFNAGNTDEIQKHFGHLGKICIPRFL